MSHQHLTLKEDPNTYPNGDKEQHKYRIDATNSTYHTLRSTKVVIKRL
jgi:hypothetical protein